MKKINQPTANVENLTAESLSTDFGSDINAAIEFVNGLRMPYPVRPAKPMLPTNADSKGIRIYAGRVEEYEIKCVTFLKEKDIWRDAENKINGILEQYLKEEAGLFNAVPTVKQQNKVWALAWDEGHSSGYASAYQYLCQLVDLFIIEG